MRSSRVERGVRRAPWHALVLWLVCGCAATPPQDPHNLCAVFSEKPGWYRSALASEDRWNIEPAVMMAVMYRESAYVHDARPPRTKLLWVVPWKRPSSAFGYAQATDETWADYLGDAGRWGADRDQFAHAVDFVGWYLDRANRHNGISRQNAKHLYLAYHQGLTGYQRGTWKNINWLVGAADAVAERAGRYRNQLSGCRSKLKRRSRWWRW